MQEGRLFKILYHLLNKGHATAPELAEKLEVSVRTVYRDIDALSEAGIPVYTETGRSGGIHLMSDFVLGKAMLSEKEKKELLAALQSLAITGDKTYESGLLEKLSAIFSAPAESWFEVDFSRWGNETRDRQWFELLKTAILKHRFVKLHYVGTNSSFTERKVQPVKLIYKSRAWYLNAYCIKRQDYRLFRLSRILDCELLDEGMELVPPPQDRDASSQKYTKFVLLFSKETAYRVYDEFGPEFVEQQKNGDLLVTVWMPEDEWVIGFLLSFDIQVEVIEPIYLKEILAERAKKIYEKNKP